MLASIGRSYPAPSGVLAVRARTLAKIRNQAMYEAASLARRTQGWYAPTVGPNDATLGGLTTMRARARSARRNDGRAKKIIRALVSEMIGTGIWPRSQAPDPEFRRQVDQLFARWSKHSDADGRFDFAGQQWQVATAWLEAGEVFVRERLRLPEDGLPVPLQLQVIEPELCPHDVDHGAGATGNRVRAGIEFSAIGRRVAYRMYRTRPGDLQDIDSSQVLRIPADTVTHVYLPERPGQLRGVPHLVQALVTLQDLNGALDATLLRQRLANLFVGALVEADAAVDDAGNPVDPLKGQSIQRDTDDTATIALEPGTLLTPPVPGQRIEWNDPPKVGAEFEAFVRQYCRDVAIAGDVPYHMLTGDMSQVNDRTVRVILQEFRRFIQQLQWFVIIPQLCEPVWTWWFDRAILAGALPMPPGYVEDPERWRAVEWTPQAWPYIHPLQDVEADQKRVRAGFATKRQIIRERGDDPDAIEQERVEELAWADQNGVADDSDARKTSIAGVAQAQGDVGAEGDDDRDTRSR